MKVYISCTLDRPSAHLTLETVRTGFPTEQITCAAIGKITAEFYRTCKTLDIDPWGFEKPVYHPTLIRNFIDHAKGPLVILDGDLIFWERVDHWSFPTLLAGYYVPEIWNEFANCISLPRLHTSFLWIADSNELLRRIDEAYPLANKPYGEYCPTDPIHPRVMFLNGLPWFWDTGCGLYQMLGGTGFSKKQEDAYTHLHSASFYDVMLQRMENKQGFQLLHNEAYKDKELMRQYNDSVARYYAKQNKKATLITNGLLSPRISPAT